LDILFFGSLGIGLTAGSAAAINHLVDRKADTIMARTRNRPLPSRHLESRQVLVFALLIGMCGFGLLLIFTNLLTAILTFASLIGYAVVYTLFLKRATPQNIVIGGAAGAAPPLLGWTAVTSQIDSGAFLLFLIIYVWTPPHFWALAIHRRHEYANADIPMLPVTHGVEFTRLYILLYAILLFIVTIMPFLTGMSGCIYLICAVALGIRFLTYAIRLYTTGDECLALPTFSFSIFYLFGLFTALMLDHYTSHILIAL
jgi:protoheme IX farnesyltransferase